MPTDQECVTIARAVRQGIGAGLSAVRVFRLQGQAAIAERLEAGDSMHVALAAAGYPELFVALIEAGEEGGRLPDAAKLLEKHYDDRIRFTRNFRAKLTPAVLQLIGAVGVVAALIFILGMLGGEKPIAPIGMGLTGGRGAVIFLLACGAITAGGIVAWRMAMRSRTLPGKMLNVPVLGPYLRATATTRVCTVLGLTFDSEMTPERATMLAFRSAGNPAFASAGERVSKRLRSRSDLTRAFGEAKEVLPAEFHASLAVAEESGTVPETMTRLAGNYAEEAERCLTTLNRVVAGAVWAGTALVLIVLIFKIAGVYLAGIQDAMQGL